MNHEIDIMIQSINLINLKKKGIRKLKLLHNAFHYWKMKIFIYKILWEYLKLIKINQFLLI